MWISRIYQQDLTSQQIAVQLGIANDRLLILLKGLGRVDGVSVSQQKPTDDTPGHLRTSDGAIDQVITKTGPNSIRVENAE
ncbi:MAG: hypothetical protein AAGF24_04825 [Cyanobacteria bacterium P01_H01_bin.121]